MTELVFSLTKRGAPKFGSAFVFHLKVPKLFLLTSLYRRSQPGGVSVASDQESTLSKRSGLQSGKVASLASMVSVAVSLIPSLYLLPGKDKQNQAHKLVFQFDDVQVEARNGIIVSSLQPVAAAYQVRKPVLDCAAPAECRRSWPTRLNISIRNFPHETVNFRIQRVGDQAYWPIRPTNEMYNVKPW